MRIIVSKLRGREQRGILSVLFCFACMYSAKHIRLIKGAHNKGVHNIPIILFKKNKNNGRIIFTPHYTVESPLIKLYRCSKEKNAF